MGLKEKNMEIITKNVWPMCKDNQFHGPALIFVRFNFQKNISRNSSILSRKVFTFQENKIFVFIDGAHLKTYCIII